MTEIETKSLYKLGRFFIRPYLRFRFNPQISGTQNVPSSGAVLFVSNHLGALDTFLIPSFAPRQVHFLAKASLFDGRFKNLVMRSIGAVPVYREAGSAAQEALHLGKNILLSGRVFAVFPEGSRSKTGLLNRGRSGASWLALETGATVIPIGLRGTDPQNLKTKKNAVEMIIGEKIDLEDLKNLPASRARKVATERIMQKIAALSGQTMSGEYAEGGRGA